MYIQRGMKRFRDVGSGVPKNGLQTRAIFFHQILLYDNKFFFSTYDKSSPRLR